MGQTISVSSSIVGDVALFDTNRSITGQDGGGFGSAGEAAAAPGYGAELASRVFATDPAVAHVFVASNGVSVKRAGGWDPATVDAVASVISEFFVFYREAAS